MATPENLNWLTTSGLSRFFGVVKRVLDQELDRFLLLLDGTRLNCWPRPGPARVRLSFTPPTCLDTALNQFRRCIMIAE